MGEYDWTTPVAMVKDYYETITSPNKQLQIIKDAGHNVMFDQPETFCNLIKLLISK